MKKSRIAFCILLLCLSSFLFCDEAKKDEKTELEKQLDILNYGLESDITDLISSLTEEKDVSISKDVLNLFNQTRNVNIRKKILFYFQKLEDPCLKDFCLEFLLDPYDEETEYVGQVMQYVSELHITEAVDSIMDILKSDNEQFKSMCFTAIGKLGGPEEAKYLIDYLREEELETTEKQFLMKALGELAVVETYDDLVEIAQDEDENTYVRRYAIEAASKMGKNEVIQILVDMNQSKDPAVRAVVVSCSGNFVPDDPDALTIVLDGLKDNHQSVRAAAIKICREKKLVQAEKSLVFRAKSDPVTNLKYDSYYALAAINTKEASNLLASVISDSKASETARAKAVDAALEYSVSECYDEIKDTTRKALEDDKLKNLRYAIGKSIAKHKTPHFEDICMAYLEHKDVSTKGTGLDMYASSHYADAKQIVEKIAESEEKANNPLKKKAQLILQKASR
ncbi:MAG: HEAT repeat domain-containing protein [Treponemataceae bacterium]|nr:HEAT repeat domain-containing protein [Treponemataceae bacterium]